mgnify:CR=1 FL=1
MLFQERYDGSVLCEHRTKDDVLISEVYYGYSKQEAIRKFTKMLMEMKNG